MDPPQIEPSLALRRIIFIIGCLIVAVCIYSIVSVVLIAQDTGIVHIVASDSKATISIGQANHQTIIVGSGKAKVRLRPGIYQVSASDNGYQTTSKVLVDKKHLTTSNLKLVAASSNSSSYNLFDLLPFLGPGANYQITKSVVTSGSDSGPLLIISAVDRQARINALKWIRSQGYNPSDYNLQYKSVKIVNYHYTEGLPQ